MTSNELRSLSDIYPISLEALLRASLDFVAFVMVPVPGFGDRLPTSVASAPKPVVLPPSKLLGASVNAEDQAAAEPPKAADDDEKPAAPAPPCFIHDFCGRVLRACTMRPEIQRVSAIVEDTVLNLRAQRLRVEAFGPATGLGLGGKRRVESFIDPAATVPEDDQYVTPETLGLLHAVKEIRLSKKLVLASCLPVAGSGVKNPIFPDWEDAMRRGLTLTKRDLERWLPLLQLYGWVPQALTLGEPLRAADAEAMVAGFGRYLSLLAEAMCFLFSVTSNLRHHAFREDLLVIRLRAQQNARALEQRLLEIEACVHRINYYSGALTDKALILASKVGAGVPIFGGDDAVPGVEEHRREQQSEPEGASSAEAAVTYLSPDDEVV